MKLFHFTVFSSVGLVVLALLWPSARRPMRKPPRPAAPATTEETTDEEAAPLTLDELKILAARIALYPDDLVALTIAASLYPLQIVQAARFLEEKKKIARPRAKRQMGWQRDLAAQLSRGS